MALTAAFHERLAQMEEARNHRLSLLQAEKELQAAKSQLLSTKHASIRSTEQRCLMLDQKIASQNLKISVLKSEIGRLNADYSSKLLQFRDLKSEIEELEELEKDRDRFYEEKTREMEEFKVTASKFVVQCRGRIEEQRAQLSELLSNSMKLRDLSSLHGQYDGIEVAAAEKQRHNLLAKKEKLDRELASNYEARANLQKLISGF